MSPLLTALLLAAGGGTFAWTVQRRLRPLLALRAVERTDRPAERPARCSGSGSVSAGSSIARSSSPASST